MSSESNIGHIIFNQMSENKYSSLIPTEGEFYVTPDYINLPLLTSMWFDHIVNDISWLRSDTFAWQSGDVYTAVYNHLINDYNNGTSATDTINGTEVWYRRAEDGHKIVFVTNTPAHQDGAVEAIYNSTGVAWYYILDTTNHRFKLPRTKFGFTGLRNNVGNYVAPGLPNITGGSSGWLLNGGGREANGVFAGNRYITDSVSGLVANPNWNIIGGGGEAYRDLNFNASYSNSIYGNSNTVQPPATQMYLYFYAGNFTNSAIEQTAGINAELLNQCRAALEEFNNIKTPNYYFYRWEGLSSISSVQEHRVSFTNKRGNPIYISISGDNNPTSDSAWLGISLYKDGVKLGYQIAESRGASWNIPFCLNYMDTNVIKGTTYGYTIKLYDGGNGTINLQESGTTQAPKISIFEL